MAKKQEKKQERTESAALRQILDSYFKIIKKKGLPNEPLRKISPVGLKVLPRTIRKEQDRKLREIAEQTGWRISELIREAVETVRTEDLMSSEEERSWN